MMALIRALPALVLLLAAPALAAEDRIEPVRTDDGLYTQEWFLMSFLDLNEDLADSAAEGKRLAVLWEQKGCPYCRDLHTVNLADPEINAWIRERFNIVQLNLWGDRQVTDFDGEVLSEKKLARKYGVQFTPTIQFFPENPEAAAGKSGREAEVARMPGYFRPFHFISMFEWVWGKKYEEDPNFQRYIIDKANAEGGVE